MPGNSTAQSIEVCFSPALFPYITTTKNFIVVVVDILRATTSICAAFQYGVKEIIPVATLEEAYRYKERGYLVAAEKEGEKPLFADFDNSPFEFMNGQAKGKTVVYFTTNGTHAIRTAGISTGVVIGAFTNIGTLAKWLTSQDKNIVVLCAGWKNTFCLEDTLFAGALTGILTNEKGFTPAGDSAAAALDLWSAAKDDLPGYVSKASHLKRLKRLGLDNVLEYSVTPDTASVIPAFKNDRLTDIGPLSHLEKI